MGVVKTALILGCLSLLTLPTVLATNITVQEDPELRIFEGLIQQELVEILSKFEGLYIPAIPTTNIEYKDLVSVAFSLNNINLSGVSEVNVTEFTYIKDKGSQLHNKPLNNKGSQSLTIVFPRMSIMVGNYIATGHLVNVPMNGEGPMSLTLYGLSINLRFDWEKISMISGVCVADNSTKFNLDIRRTEINFKNLNQGTDQGQLINIMLSSFGPDIVDYLELQLNTSLHGPIDDALISLLNKYCPKKDNILDLQVSDAAQFLEDFLQSVIRASPSLKRR